MRRTLYTDDHEAYRETVRTFFDREVFPNLPRWDEQRLIDRDILRLAAKQGISGLKVPETYGGAGEDDYRYRMIVNEEVARTYSGAFGMTLALQDDLVLPYLLSLATDEQKQRWLPGMANGEQLCPRARSRSRTATSPQCYRTARGPAGPPTCCRR